MRFLHSAAACAPLATLALCACSTDASSVYPYPDDETRVIGGAADSSSASQSDPDHPGVSPIESSRTSAASVCLDDADPCETPADRCGGHASADVLLDASGEAAAVVCYPREGRELVELGDGATAPRAGDDTLVAIDGAVDGDVVVEGDHVVVAGSGPDHARIGRNLEVLNAGAIVRGVRIEGDAILRKDDVSLIDCVIDGDLLVIGDGARIALCQVWGDVVLDGHDALLVSNIVAGDQQLSGVSLRCNDDHRFTDVDGDGAVQRGDVLGPVNCTQAAAASLTLAP